MTQREKATAGIVPMKSKTWPWMTNNPCLAPPQGFSRLVIEAVKDGCMEEDANKNWRWSLAATPIVFRKKVFCAQP